MAIYISKRVGQAFMTIFAALIIVFILVRMAGDPVLLMVPPEATPAQIEHMRVHLGMDGSEFHQFLQFVWHLLHGDLGTSLVSRQAATTTVLDRLPATLQLGGVSFALTLLIAIPVGVYAAARPGGRFDRIVRSLLAVGQAIPAFWLGALLILLFSVGLGWLPTSGRGGLANLVMPVITLSAVSIASLARLTRSSMVETLRSEYVKFARTKGASASRVLWSHSFKNAFLTVLTLAALLLLNTLSGAVIVETIFSWPGVGNLAITSVSARDFPVVQAVVLLLAIAYSFGNLLVDLAYGFLNPQIRLS